MNTPAEASHLSRPRWLLATITIGISVVFTLVALEVLCRFLPVVTGLNLVPVNEGNPVRRYEPNTDFVYSRGWNLRGPNRGRVNNSGFINRQDYIRSASPLLAIVGDSYVEALMVPYDSTIQGRLATHLKDSARVYSFGVSGSPLSEYMADAQFARDSFRPTLMAIVVVGNDFDESLLSPVSIRGGHFFRKDSAGKLQWTLLNYAPSRLHRIIKRSALERYLVANVHVVGGRLMQEARESRAQAYRWSYVGNTATTADSARITDSKGVVDEFLREIPEKAGLPPDRIVFLVDGARPQLYDPAELAQVSRTYFGQMRAYFIERATALGFEAVDLQPIFAASHQRSGVRFEFPDDAHWNSAGHAEAAAALLRSRTVLAALRADLSNRRVATRR